MLDSYRSQWVIIWHVDFFDKRAVEVKSFQFEPVVPEISATKKTASDFSPMFMWLGLPNEKIP